MIIKFVKSSSPSKIFLDYIKSINGILELTYREMEILAVLMREDFLMPLDMEPKNIADKFIRKRIIKENNITKENLSRFISKFKRKGILISDFDDLYVNPRLMPRLINNQIEINKYRIEHNYSWDKLFSIAIKKSVELHKESEKECVT